jgi:hypothetical protein
MDDIFLVKFLSVPSIKGNSKIIVGEIFIEKEIEIQKINEHVTNTFNLLIDFGIVDEPNIVFYCFVNILCKRTHCCIVYRTSHTVLNHYFVNFYNFYISKQDFVYNENEFGHKINDYFIKSENFSNLSTININEIIRSNIQERKLYCIEVSLKQEAYYLHCVSGGDKNNFIDHVKTIKSLINNNNITFDFISVDFEKPASIDATDSVDESINVIPVTPPNDIMIFDQNSNIILSNSQIEIMNHLRIDNTENSVIIQGDKVSLCNSVDDFIHN